MTRGDRSTPAALRVEDLRVSFGGIQALESVSFEIPPGEVLAVVGPNGAGKTTLLNRICGVVGRGVGRVVVNGIDVGGWRPPRIVEIGVARSFQHPPLLEAASVLDNVLIGCHTRLSYGLVAQVFRPRFTARRETSAEDTAREILAFMGLERVAASTVGSLPYGIRKRVDIARALAVRPSLLFLDEPTSGLDHAERQGVCELIRHVADSTDVTVVLVEHHMEMVRAVATRVLALRAGSVVGFDETAALLDSNDFLGVVTGGSGATSALSGGR